MLGLSLSLTTIRPSTGGGGGGGGSTETVTEAAGGTIRDGEEFIVTTTTILPDPITSVIIDGVADITGSVTRDGDYQFTATAPTDDVLHAGTHVMEIV